MLNPFPDLLAFSFFTALIFRLLLSTFLFRMAWLHLSPPTPKSDGERGPRAGALAFVEAAAAAAILLGFYVQFAALAAMGLSVILLVLRRRAPARAPHDAWTYVFTLGIALSLLFLGAGPFAFDLPL